MTNIIQTKTQELILKYLLSNPDKQVTIRGIAKKLGKSYALVYNNILNLEKNKLITKQDVPPAKVLKLNKFAPNSVFVDIELKRKEEFLRKFAWAKIMLDDILSHAKSPFFILLIFGSYAKGTQTAKSDIDLLFIVPDKKNIKDIETISAYTKVKKSINVITAANFKEMIRNTNEMNIGNEAKMHHIILHGAEEYYQLIRI